MAETAATRRETHAVDELLSLDRHARSAALDPAGSFIVQAPAGSGKTELLIQRLLAVLGQAEHPSEALAITFTNKAAGEMRERLFGALASAREPAVEGLRDVEKTRRQLALAVLQRDEALGWKLLERPDSLLIDTFDAFCARVAARAPLQQVAANAALAPIAESLDAIYLDAARAALFDDGVADESRLLLTLAVNRVDDVARLVAELLARRAQWLGEAIDTSDHAIAALNATLEHQVTQAMQRLCECWCGLRGQYDQSIRDLALFTAETFDLAGRTAQEIDERDVLRKGWPAGASIEALPLWQTLASMLLTDGGELRKPGGVNVKSGFPTGTAKEFDDIPRQRREDMKQRMQALLEALSQETRLVGALGSVGHLPTAAAISAHAHTLKATLVVLRQAAAHLLVLLRERGVTDFGGVMMAALAALRHSREDVLAGFDARLRHVLVDEVQDTNPAQFELLSLLTVDWAPGDGRTLFLVGDPMQSIYGFRDADVSLFLRAQAYGIGQVPLTALRLAANYRSQPAVVDWVNTNLAKVFATTDEGAADHHVDFAPAFATRVAGVACEHVTAMAFDDEVAEAAGLATRIAQIRTDEPDARIAVLVRSRSHASALIAALTAQGVAFSAREFADWSARETIRDLLSLTSAIAQPGDRLALFSVLRSPWVGCTLDTLSKLAAQLDGAGSGAPAWQSLRPGQAWQDELDADARRRIEWAWRAFAVADARAWLSPLSDRVLAAWYALNDARWPADAGQRAEIEAWFAWLATIAPGGALPPRHELLRLLSRQRQSFASTATANHSADGTGGVEILTIHKAKGLEWDHVFLPGSDRAQRADSRSLAQWRFVSVAGSQDRSIQIVARDSRRRTQGSVYDFVGRQTRVAQQAESKRLLYVAATRARRTLTISRSAAVKPAAAQSFAALLNLHLNAEADGLTDAASRDSEHPSTVAFEDIVAPVDQRPRVMASLRRGDTPPPVTGDTIASPAYAASLSDVDLEVPAAQRDARAEGIVGHVLFEGLAIALNVSSKANANAGGAAHHWRPNHRATVRALEDAGAANAEPIAERLVDWFASAANRANVQFIFSPNHRVALNEWTLPLTRDADAAGSMLRVDRSFITQNGERWVVDFKFSKPEAPPCADSASNDGGQGAETLERWLTAQTDQYRPQLAGYARRLAALDGVTTNDVRAALYFPWLDRLVELEL